MDSLNLDRLAKGSGENVRYSVPSTAAKAQRNVRRNITVLFRLLAIEDTSIMLKTINILQDNVTQMTGCVELFLLACYILINHVYELPCMYNDVCNAECGLQLRNKVGTYLLIIVMIIKKSSRLIN